MAGISLLERSDSLAAVQLLPAPYLLFLGDTVELGFAKTALGLRQWAPDKCLGEHALPTARVTTGLPRFTPWEAAQAGARSMVIGVANPGGIIPDIWLPEMLSAIRAGLDLVGGMHSKLTDVPELVAAAEVAGTRLIDIRVPPSQLPVGTGQKRGGRRLLTVGTDCALGKKYTALAVARGLRERGVDATFRASGQTGMMVAGEGIAFDAVVIDFAAGAAELLSPSAPPDHLDVIEGQGSLFHPSYAAVSLALLHGSQPDMFIVCHEPGRQHILGHPTFALPSIEAVIEQTIRLGQLTNPAIRCVGISLNTAGLDPDEAAQEMGAISDRVGLPAADPVRAGPEFEALLDACQR